MAYNDTLARVETYFDQTATKTWEKLTSDAPVSRIRQTVREGRDQMRDVLLSRLPNDLRGARILDAGCGVGGLSQILAEKGAHVVAADISPSLIDIAKKRIPQALHDQISFRACDLNDPALGQFDYVVAMDSLIYYRPADLCHVLQTLSARVHQSVVFTVAPRTPLLMAMWYAGKLMPKSDRSPVMHPHAPRALGRALGESITLLDHGRVLKGFYISQALEVRR